MPFDFQFAVDSSQPHVLADWWAETLGWVVEPSAWTCGWAKRTSTRRWRG